VAFNFLDHDSEISDKFNKTSERPFNVNDYK